MDRLATIKRHLTSASNTPESPPVVYTPDSFSKDPLPFLQKSKRKYPDLFKVRRSRRTYFSILIHTHITYTTYIYTLSIFIYSFTFCSLKLIIHIAHSSYDEHLRVTLESQAIEDTQ